MNWKPKQRELKTEAEIASLTRADWDKDAALPWPARPLWDGPDLDAAFDAKVDELFPELASLQQRVKDSFAAGEDRLRLELPSGVAVLLWTRLTRNVPASDPEGVRYARWIHGRTDLVPAVLQHFGIPAGDKDAAGAP